MDGGVDPTKVGRLTFNEVDLYIQRQKKIIEDGWDYTRSIISALTGKKPREIIRLSRDPEPKKWTQEEAIETIKRLGGKWPSKVE